MKKYFVIVLVFIFDLVFGQGNHSTINVVTLQNISIPDSSPLIFQHVTEVKNVSITLKKIFDDGTFKKVSHNIKYYQTPNNKELIRLTNQYHGRAPSVMFTLSGSILNPGKYELEFSLNSLTDFKKPIHIKTKKYFVIVTLPTISSPEELATSYFYGESIKYSFAMNELTDPTAYSYKIFDTDRKLVIYGQGNIINLDSILTQSNLIGKELFIEGYYNNQIIHYKKPYQNNDGIYSTNWKIKIKKPQLNFYTIWATNNKKNKKLRYISFFNERSKDFMFTYVFTKKVFGKVEYVFIVPNEFRILRVESNPANFLTQSIKRSKKGPIYSIKLSYNKNFLYNRKWKDVELTFYYVTPFENGIKTIKFNGRIHK